MNRYDVMEKQANDAIEALERLRAEVSERAEVVGIIELDPSDPDNPALEPLDEGAAASAVIALSEVFEIVKALADESVIELPSEPLPLLDAALVTILVNAERARRGMLADLKWITEKMEALRA